MRAGVPKQPRADSTDEDTGRGGGVQAVHDPDPVQRLQPRGMSVDRDLQKTGADPDDGQEQTSAETERAMPGSHSTAPKKSRKIGTSRAPKTSASLPATSIAGRAASATHSNASPSCASLAPVAR